MSKITFRADEDLVERVEHLDASKSEVMRAALRTYLEREAGDDPADDPADAPARDVNVNVTIETPEASDAEVTAEATRETGHGERRQGPGDGTNTERSCAQCGEGLAREHVYCPNCGEKATHRFFCDCGDELRSDWSHCPSCGRRTPSADVLER